MEETPKNSRGTNILLGVMATTVVVLGITELRPVRRAIENAWQSYQQSQLARKQAQKEVRAAILSDVQPVLESNRHLRFGASMSVIGLSGQRYTVMVTPGIRTVKGERCATYNAKRDDGAAPRATGNICRVGDRMLSKASLGS